MAAAMAAMILIGMSPGAHADTQYWPASSGDWNGQKVYLSRACHDEGTGACQERFGCDGYQENFWSEWWARYSLRNQNVGGGAGFLERGYAVRIGDGLVSQNIASSNAWGSTLHIPLHTNARTRNCATNDPSYGGTWVLYVSSRGQELSQEMLNALYIGPGSNDKLVRRTDLGELNQTNMPAAYMETEFHTWSHGVTFLTDAKLHSWRLALGVDRCRGYPRAGQGPTRTKYCSW